MATVTGAKCPVRRSKGRDGIEPLASVGHEVGGVALIKKRFLNEIGQVNLGRFCF
jgi:hypothetical protein